jgi:hypothetical protein
MSFITITYLFLERGKNSLLKYLGLIIVIIFAYDHYALIQFSKTSALLLVTASLGIFTALLSSERRYALIVWSFLLAYMGTGFRMVNIYPVLMFVSLFTIIYFILKREHIFALYQSGNWKKKIAPCIICVALFIGIFIGNDISKAIDDSTDELKYYNNYNAARSKFIDYPTLNYQDNHEFYEGLKISENDLMLMKSWYLDFDTIASFANLKAINETQNIKVDKVLWRDGVTPMIMNMIIDIEVLSIRGFHIILLIIFSLGGIVFFRNRWILFPILLGILSIALYVYLTYLGRPIYRATYVIDLSTMCWLLYSITFASEFRHRAIVKKRTLIALSMIVLCVNIFFTVSVISKNTNTEIVENTSEVLEEYIQQHTTDVFVIDVGVSIILERNTVISNPLSVHPKEFHKNYFGFGGWTVLSPYFLDKLQKYGLSNVYGDIIDNENVYVIDNNDILPKEKFFTDHYAKSGEHIYYDFVDEIGGYKLWQIKTKRE